MPVVIELPQVGESVTEGIIGKWLKQPGDLVDKYEPLVEVVTDKINMEVPAPYSGTLTTILANEGDTVPMGSPIAEMDTNEVVSPVAPKPSAESDSERPSAQSTGSPIGRTGVLLKDVRPVGPTGAGEEPPLPETVLNPASPFVPAKSEDAAESRTTAVPDRQRYSPIVRRLAVEHNVDLTLIHGTGLGGRVTKDDVMRYLDEPKAGVTDVPSVAPLGSQVSNTESDEEMIPLTPLRRIIAENMVRSATQIPQAWSYQEVDVAGLVGRREGIKAEFREREGVELTYLPFVIKAVAESLKENPLLNSSWGDNKIILKRRINIGIAVAAPNGLVVPVIHDADKLSVNGLAHACRDLTQRARESHLELSDVQGGTFTLNNTGALGSIVSQPLVNPPQAAILTTESIVKRPVVLPGDAIAIRPIMNICLSFDHRILDGAETAAFMMSVKKKLEAINAETPIY
ncbi:MAG: dihydrolipoamide acetyltransferase family protein [Chloroflexota bacterium]|nr:dihydrolipoamide acetyltransferase family protein [Chloroflexota bacterium]